MTNGVRRYSIIILCFIREGKPWTLAVAAIYRAEVGCAPVVAADQKDRCVCFMEKKMKEETPDAGTI